MYLLSSVCLVLAAKGNPLTKFSFKCQAVCKDVCHSSDWNFSTPFRIEILSNTRVCTQKARKPSAAIPICEIIFSPQTYIEDVL